MESIKVLNHEYTTEHHNLQVLYQVDVRNSEHK